jgi:hypothetical protein
VLFVFRQLLTVPQTIFVVVVFQLNTIAEFWKERKLFCLESVVVGGGGSNQELLGRFMMTLK